MAASHRRYDPGSGMNHADGVIFGIYDEDITVAVAANGFGSIECRADCRSIVTRVTPLARAGHRSTNGVAA